MEPKRLCRASIDKKICGVCGGLAHYLGVSCRRFCGFGALLVLHGSEIPDIADEELDLPRRFRHFRLELMAHVVLLLLVP